MSTLLSRFLDDDSGATAIEYGLIVSLISMMIIPSLQSIAPVIDGTLQQVSAALAK